MAGRQAANVVTRYAGIQVQTSALGVSVPLGWGTFRCKCNLMDYLDFKSTPQSGGKTGGKGGPQTTGYSYKATIILAICEGPIDSITSVYVDSNIYIDGVKTALQQANLNMFTGAVGQPVWNYLTSHHPDHAIGYSGLAIAFQSNYALEASAAPPNHSFEVVRLTGFGVTGAKDADPSIVMADFFQNPRTGVPLWPASGLLGPMSQYQDYCLAAGLLVSPVIDQQQSASEFVTELLKATNSTCVWSEGVLKFIPYGDTAVSGNGKSYTPPNTPVYSLNDDDFVQDNGGEPVLQVDIEDQSDAYNVVQLEYLDRTNQYNMAIALASDAANVAQYGARRKDPDTVHCICDPDVAAISAQLYLQRTLYIRAQYRFKLGWMFALLEPGDIVELTDAGLGLAAYTVRVIQIDEDEKYGLSFICEDYPIGVAHTPLYEMQNGQGFAANQTIDPGGPEANLLTWSDDATNAAWSKTNLTVTGAAGADQYGLTTAAILVPTAVGGAHQLLQTCAAFAGVNYTFAVCLQQDAHSLAQVVLTDATASGVVMTVDLSAGVISSPAVAYGTDAVLVGASISPTLVAGIWQCTITAQFPTLAGGHVAAGVSVLDSTGNATWTGDGSNAFYVSQFQLRQGIAAGTYAATQAAPATPLIFNPPAVLASGVEVWAAVAGGPWWGGCDVWTSVDGTNYQQIGTIDGPARYGSATAAFASHADPDTVNSLSVDLGPSAGALTGASQVTADNGGTLCLIDNELIAYEAASLTNPSRYTLGTYIRRGYMNTPIAAHAAGATFVRLDNGVFQFPYLATNVGQTVYVKFQSFNLWGKGQVALSDCIAYPFIPLPVGAAAPGSAAWTATGTTLSNNGQSIPAIVITGMSDNPSATAIEFDYRVSGTSAWISGGVASNNATQKQITSVQSGQSYDVSVVYLVGAVASNREVIAAGITVGAVATGPTAGSVLLDDAVPGAGKSFTLPAGAYAHVDIVLTGFGGAGNFNAAGGKSGVYYYGGGAGGTAVKLSFAVTPGTTSITYTLPSTVGSAATATAAGLSLTANSGANAATGGSGAGGTASGGTNNYTGHSGGLTDAWDGGGAAGIGGAYADQTANGQPGLAPGGGGAGATYNPSTGAWTASPGAGASIQIIARA